MVTPIALFVYARPEHTRKTVEALLQNPEALQSDLFIFADAAKTPSVQNAVDAVRKYIREIGGFKSITLIEREHNLGLAASIIDGVTTLCNRFGRVIVMEDDLVTAPFFLKFMNESLAIFENDERVISIHGYVYPIHANLPETFFLRGADCWGWATWKRGWDIFNPDGKQLLSALKAQKLNYFFDFNGTFPYTRMLKEQIIGKNNSWAIRWYASAFLANKLTLYPGQSLVRNIGNDASGTHSGNTSSYDVMLSKSPICVDPKIIVEHSQVAHAEFTRFFKKDQIGRFKKMFKLIKATLRSGR